MAKRVIEIPDHLKELGDAFEAVLGKVQARIARSGGGKAVDFAQVERELAAGAAQVERASEQALLQALDIDLPVVIIGKERYIRVGRCAAEYHGMAGSVSVTRSLYRRSGTRGGTPEGRVVDPVSLRAGVVGDGWLPQTARAMAHEVQKGTSREAKASADELGRLPYARSSFERVAHLLGALAVAGQEDIEDALIEAYEVPAEARSVSVSLDRVSVPMEEPLARPVGRPRKGAPKKPIEVNYRMAYCGTVTLHDKEGESLHTIRYGCMPEGDFLRMRDRLVADVATLVSKRPLDIVVLCDGAPELWNLLDAWFAPEHFEGVRIYRMVDFHHVMEKLGTAARVIDGAGMAGPRLSRWRLDLLNRTGAAGKILREIVETDLDEGPGEGHPVHDAITYLRSNHETDARMDYPAARAVGLPIASGNVEATCKSLIELRFKRCGSRWKNDTGQHIVQLRALALSDRWGPAIELTLRPLRSAIRAACSG